MTKRQGIRAILFLIVLSAVLWTAGSVIGLPKDADISLITRRFNELRTDEKNTWDGIFIGTSMADRAWAAPVAWEEYGMAVYPMATDGQPFVLSTAVIEEVRKYQDISFVMVELHGTRPATLKANDGRMRKVTQHLSVSMNRFNAITKTLEHMDKWYPGYYDDSAINRLSYYIPLIKFHKRVTSDQFYLRDIYAGVSELKGVYEAARHVAATQVKVSASDAYTELGEEPRELLNELFAYAEEAGIQLIFINTPDAMSEEVKGYVNGAVKYVEDHGYPVLNFYDEEVLEASGINGQDDFIDKKHLNTAGAVKFTDYVGDWLKEIIDIPDHRGDEKYESWDEAVENFKVFYEEFLVGRDAWKERKLKKK